MALPKKGLRKITVDNFNYAWSATGNDGFISLSVAPLDNEGQLLTSSFGSHSKIVSESRTADGQYNAHTKQQLIFTPYVVRQVIEYALQQGWNPRVKGPQFDLIVEGKIDLRLSSQA